MMRREGAIYVDSRVRRVRAVPRGSAAKLNGVRVYSTKPDPAHATSTESPAPIRVWKGTANPTAAFASPPEVPLPAVPLALDGMGVAGPMLADGRAMDGLEPAGVDRLGSAGAEEPMLGSAGTLALRLTLGRERLSVMPEEGRTGALGAAEPLEAV